MGRGTAAALLTAISLDLANNFAQINLLNERQEKLGAKYTSVLIGHHRL